MTTTTTTTTTMIMKVAALLCLCTGISAFSPLSTRHVSRNLITNQVKPVSVVSKTRVDAVTNRQEAAETPAAAAAPADYDALLKYHVSIATEMTLIAGVLYGLDTVVGATGVDIPYWATLPVFYAFSLKSRVFNPLRNDRPNMEKAIKGGSGSAGFRDRKMPSWTPPGVVFPIMWLLIIGPIRAYSSALVFGETGHFLNPAIMALMFHLSVGDVWNTINNIERRYGAAVTGVLCVTGSALNAAYQYYQINETAGNLLGSIPMIWFAVASSLVTATWQINTNNDDNGQRDPLYPVEGQAQTEFAWFQ